MEQKNGPDFFRELFRFKKYGILSKKKPILAIFLGSASILNVNAAGKLRLLPNKEIWNFGSVEAYVSWPWEEDEWWWTADKFIPVDKKDDGDDVEN